MMQIYIRVCIMLSGSTVVQTIKFFQVTMCEIKSIAFIPGEKKVFTSGFDGQLIQWSINGNDQNQQVIYFRK